MRAPRLAAAWTRLVAPLGAWRTQLVWRLFGLVSALSIVLLFGRQENVVDRFRAAPLGFHALLVCGLLLIAAGPRPAVLALTAIAAPMAIVPIITGRIDLMVGDEYLMLIVLPIMGVVVTSILAVTDNSERGRNRRMDAAHVALFRITGLTAGFFAAFHKLNEDFFNPDVSCATGLALFLEDYWQLPVPDFVLYPSPFQILVAEALVPVLLVCCPRIGIFYTALVMGLIGHIGPAPFTLFVITSACAFFRPQDGPMMLTGLRRFWGWLAVLLFIVAAVSFATYRGEHLWFLFLAEEVVVVTLSFWLVYLMIVLGRRYIGRMRREPDRRRLFGRLLVPRIDLRAFHVAGAARWVLAIYLGLSLFNGVTPYLGMKFRFSYAMLSNLRVDTTRWNSWVVPSWVYPREHDPFVRVTRFTLSGTFLSDETMETGLMSPVGLGKRVRELEEREVPFDIELAYRGESFSFEDASNHPEFRRWLDGMPSNRLFQAWLPAEGPQPCLH